MFSPEAMANFMTALEMMGKGMLGIFIVLSIIAIIVFIFARVTSRKKKDGDVS